MSRTTALPNTNARAYQPAAAVVNTSVGVDAAAAAAAVAMTSLTQRGD